MPPSSVLAQVAPSTDLQNQLLEIQRTLSSSHVKIEAIQEAMVGAMRAQREISLKLTGLNADIQKRRPLVAKIQEKLKLLQADETIQAENYKSQRGRLRLVVSELFAARRVSDRKIAADILAGIVPRLQKQKALSHEALLKLQKTRQALQVEFEALNMALVDLQKDEAAILLLQHQSQAFAAATTKDLAAEKQKMAQLADKAKTLDALIKALGDSKPPAPSSKVATDKESFEALKGKLGLPARGVVSARFGDDAGVGVGLEGIGIVTDPLAPVTSPIHARVEFAGSFRSYGQLIILNAGDGYLVLLAGMTQISATQGQEVWAGEPIGLMGKKPSAPGLLGEKTRKNQPNLYIEFRKDNKVIDSTPWWVDGLKEAFNDTRR